MKRVLPRCGILSFGFVALLSASSLPLPANPSLSLKDLAIPETIGRVEERFQGTTDRWVIHIQDVHAHFVAQENISAIADHLNALYGIKTIALEAGWGDTTLPQSWGLPQSREKQILARALLEEEIITGPVYSALFSQMPTELIGLEDGTLYQENRRTYLEHLDQLFDIASGLESYREALEIKKKSAFSATLLAFEKALEKYREGITIEKFIPILLARAGEQNIDFAQYDQINLFREVTKLEKRVDQDRLRAEAERLSKPFKKERFTFEELLRSGRIPKDKLEFYPETKKFLELIGLRDQIYHGAFFNQIESLIADLKTRLITSDEEAALSEKIERYWLARKILLLEATPADLEGYVPNHLAIRSDMGEAGLEKALELSLHFYTLAKKRDDVFLQKITTDPKLSGNIIVVAGGFHTEGLSQRLREAGISYLVVQPDLGKTSPDQELYMKRMRDHIVQGQTLGHLQNRIFQPAFDSVFPQAVLDLRENRNIPKAVQMVTDALTQSGTPVTAVPQTREGSMTFEAFLALSEEDKLLQLREWTERFKTAGAIPIAIVARQALLAESIFADEFSLSVWQAMRRDRTKTLVILLGETEDIHMETIGGIAPMIRERGEADIRQVMENPRLQKRLEKFLNEGRIAAIEKPGYDAGSLLVFPPIRGVLLLIPPILEGRLGISDDPAIQARFWDAVQYMLARYASMNEFLQAA
ncbi:MAG: hypothetical protein JW893_05750 [Candidatus Omnitrophica bacterium]|nr:hypothetical protein [Candidatus Omnitrophota bacterium]